MKKRILLPVLFCLALLLLLVGCGNKGGKGGDTTDIAEPVAPVNLAADGATEFVIVRGNNAGKTVQTAASNLWSVFKEKTGAPIDLCDEWRYEDKGKPAAIVVGITADEVSVRLRSELKNDDYAVHAEGGNLYLIGGSDAATVNAVNYFIEHYLNETVQTLTLEGDLDLRYTKDYPMQALSVAGVDISSYRIVYDADLYYSKVRAEDIRQLIIETCGVVLDVVPDTQEAAANEILVGVTNRAESQVAVAGFDRPNYYWSVGVSGTKLVFANQGVRTGEAALDALTKYLGALKTETADLTAANLTLSGDVKSTDKRALARPEGTDVRVLHSNVLGFLTEGNDNGYTDQQRAELLVDTYFLYYPDVLTLNEMTPTTNLTPILRRLISEYYVIIDAEYLALYPDLPNQNQVDSRTTQRLYSFPVAYRKDAGLTVIDSGYNYLSDMLSFHGCAWTVFQTADGNRFLAASAHLSENKTSSGQSMTTWAEDVMEAVNEARKLYGDLPMALNGDWFFAQNLDKIAYDYIIAQGFEDVSETAVTKHSVAIGTYHTIGLGEQGRVEEDIIFSTPSWFKALSHKIIVDFYTVNGSDHYPVLADLQFVKSAKAEDIPKYDDGSEQLEIVDEGPGGSGTWASGVTQQ